MESGAPASSHTPISHLTSLGSGPWGQSEEGETRVGRLGERLPLPDGGEEATSPQYLKNYPKLGNQVQGAFLSLKVSPEVPLLIFLKLQVNVL